MRTWHPLNVLCPSLGYCGKSGGQETHVPACTALLVKDDNGGEPSSSLDEEAGTCLIERRSACRIKAVQGDPLIAASCPKPSDFSLNIVREICFMWRALMVH
ncbi:hypothetical protein GWK47_043723 [Chionoecetes opilio]|uniref:Uncharacterized protein n=1 Tax=Chionoecetes opilio TaxID=41210 RepID=A0A8J4YHB7_CHIOP|nr:hypothetical protein GWK47_043723 [Chionoecetes opilio]